MPVYTDVIYVQRQIPRGAVATDDDYDEVELRQEVSERAMTRIRSLSPARRATMSFDDVIAWSESDGA